MAGQEDRGLRPLPDPPTERFLISLRREEGQTPPGLEREIADLVQAAIPAALDDEEESWQLAGETDRTPKAVAVGVRLYHGCDQIAADNRRRVEERDRQRPASEPHPPDLGALQEKIMHAVRRCYLYGIQVVAEVAYSASPLTHPSRTDVGSES